MPDCHVAVQGAHLIVVESIRDEAKRADAPSLACIIDDDDTG
jgi:hypothetical protein